MRHDTKPRVLRAAACALLAAPILSVAACSSDSSNEEPTPTKTVTETPSEDTGGDSEQGTLPDMAGKDLQAAQDEAQANGFYVLDSTDATGEGRLQLYDRNWVVCSQTPEAGKHPTDVTVTFDAVKQGETCP